MGRARHKWNWRWFLWRERMNGCFMALSAEVNDKQFLLC